MISRRCNELTREGRPCQTTVAPSSRTGAAGHVVRMGNSARIVIPSSTDDAFARPDSEVDYFNAYWSERSEMYEEMSVAELAEESAATWSFYETSTDLDADQHSRVARQAQELDQMLTLRQLSGDTAPLEMADLWDLEFEHDILLQAGTVDGVVSGRAARLEALERELVRRTMPMINEHGVSPAEIADLVASGVIPKAQAERIFLRVCGFRHVEAARVAESPSAVTVAYGLGSDSSLVGIDPHYGTLTQSKILRMRDLGVISRRTARRLQRRVS